MIFLWYNLIMSKIQKLIDRFLSCPKDFSYDDVVKILNHFGYEEQQRSGSRVRFINQEKNTSLEYISHTLKIISKPYILRKL